MVAIFWGRGDLVTSIATAGDASEERPRRQDLVPEAPGPEIIDFHLFSLGNFTFLRPGRFPKVPRYTPEPEIIDFICFSLLKT